MGAHYVYRVYDADERLIYIGCTENLAGRLRAHRMNSWWSSQAARVVAKVYRDKRCGRAAELAAIKSENPRWNIKGRYSNTSSWTPQDFHDYYTAVENAAPATPARTTHLHNISRRFKRVFGHELPCAVPYPPLADPRDRRKHGAFEADRLADNSWLVHYAGEPASYIPADDRYAHDIGTWATCPA